MMLQAGQLPFSFMNLREPSASISITGGMVESVIMWRCGCVICAPASMPLLT
jgi:hypothetical protein